MVMNISMLAVRLSRLLIMMLVVFAPCIDRLEAPLSAFVEIMGSAVVSFDGATKHRTVFSEGGGYKPRFVVGAQYKLAVEVAVVATARADAAGP